MNPNTDYITPRLVIGAITVIEAHADAATVGDANVLPLSMHSNRHWIVDTARAHLCGACPACDALREAYRETN